MTTPNRICAHKPDHKDQRDAMLTYESQQTNLRSSLQQQQSLTAPKTLTMPEMYPVYDQLTYGSCVANACAYSILTQSKKTIEISRLFVYANSRMIDYVPLNQDVGTSILSTCKALSRYGSCPESLFPHSKKPSEIPSLETYKQSVLLPSFSYYNISRDVNVLKACLQDGKPIIFGVIVYDSFLSAQVMKTGKVPMPNKRKETRLGGHCVCMVGYNDFNSTFICANSWGSGWGQNGFFFLPYNYIRDATLSIDFTVLTFSTTS